MLCVEPDMIEPTVNAEATVTARLALPVGLLMITDTEPLPLDQVMCTCGNGVPLLLPENVPLDTDQVIVDPCPQLPDMV